MSRNYGIVSIATNLEVQYASSLDARGLAQKVSDLSTPGYFKSFNDIDYSYLGLTVAVVGDAENLNGVYELIKEDYTAEDAWARVAMFEVDPENPSSLIPYKTLGNLPTINEITVEGTKYADDYLLMFLGSRVVDVLPELEDARINTLYFVPVDETKAEYLEWMIRETEDGGREWEQIGATTADLSSIDTRDELEVKAFFHQDPEENTYTGFGEIAADVPSLNGMSLQDLVERLFYPDNDPEIVDPSFYFTLSSDKIYSTTDSTLDVSTFADRGSSGYAEGESVPYAGEAEIQFFVDGVEAEVENGQIVIPSRDVYDIVTVSATATFAAGEEIFTLNGNKTQKGDYKGGELTYSIEVVTYPRILTGTNAALVSEATPMTFTLIDEAIPSVTNADLVPFEDIHLDELAFTLTFSAHEDRWFGWNPNTLGDIVGVATIGTASEGQWDWIYGDQDASIDAFESSEAALDDEEEITKYDWTESLGGEKTVKVFCGEGNTIAVDAPVQSGSLTYTKGAQSPTWTGFDATIMSVTGGSESSINAGTYQTEFTLEKGYSFPNNSRKINVPWTIEKAETVMSVVNTVKVFDVARTQTFTIGGMFDGVISVECMDESVVETEFDKETNVVTVTWLPEELYGTADEGVEIIVRCSEGQSCWGEDEATVLVLPADLAITWTSASTSSTNTLEDVTYIEDIQKFVAVGWSGNVTTGTVNPETGGITWTVANTSSWGTLTSALYLPDIKQVLTSSGTTTYRVGTVNTETRGISWASATKAYSNWTPVYAQEIQKIAVVGYGDTSETGTVDVETGAISWTTGGSMGVSGGVAVNGVVYVPEIQKFVGVGSNGYLRIGTPPTSGSAITWTTSGTVGNTTTLNAVAYIPEIQKLVAVGGYGAVRVGNVDVEAGTVSTSWSAFTMGTVDIHSICYAPEVRKIVCGSRYGSFVVGTVNLSDGTISWTLEGTCASIMYGITWAPDIQKFVAVGWSGKIQVGTLG